MMEDLATRIKKYSYRETTTEVFFQGLDIVFVSKKLSEILENKNCEIIKEKINKREAHIEAKCLGDMLSWHPWSLKIDIKEESNGCRVRVTAGIHQIWTYPAKRRVDNILNLLKASIKGEQPEQKLTSSFYFQALFPAFLIFLFYLFLDWMAFSYFGGSSLMNVAFGLSLKFGLIGFLFIFNFFVLLSFLKKDLKKLWFLPLTYLLFCIIGDFLRYFYCSGSWIVISIYWKTLLFYLLSILYFFGFSLILFVIYKIVYPFLRRKIGVVLTFIVFFVVITPFLYSSAAPVYVLSYLIDHTGGTEDRGLVINYEGLRPDEYLNMPNYEVKLICGKPKIPISREFPPSFGTCDYSLFATEKDTKANVSLVHFCVGRVLNVLGFSENSPIGLYSKFIIIDVCDAYTANEIIDKYAASVPSGGIWFGGKWKKIDKNHYVFRSGTMDVKYPSEVHFVMKRCRNNKVAVFQSIKYYPDLVKSFRCY